MYDAACTRRRVKQQQHKTKRAVLPSTRSAENSLLMPARAENAC